MTFTKYKIFVDIPAENPALGYDHQALALKEIILDSEPRFAVGIFGKWGSGKTTLMNAIRDNLKGRNAVCVDFSAWRYEKERHLIIPLLDSIREALMDWRGKVDEVNQSEVDELKDSAFNTAATVAKVLASFLAGFSFQVGLSDALKLSYDASKSLSSAREYGKTQETRKGIFFSSSSKPASEEDPILGRADPNLSQSFYHAGFQALRGAFGTFYKETGRVRIVVFVDDLDRCLPRGALEVLESMKLFFDIDGFVFVVGLDRDVVERFIDFRYREFNQVDQNDGRLINGSEYINKLFQVPFSLAPVKIDQIDELLTAMQTDSKIEQEQMEDFKGPVRNHLSQIF